MNKKFVPKSNIRLLKKRPEGNPRLDVEDLPKQTNEEGSKFLAEIRQVDDEITESLLSKR